MERDQVLFTNSKHVQDSPPKQMASGVLGAWLAGRGDGTNFTSFDPDRVAVVIGTGGGTVIGAFDTTPDPETGKTWRLVQDDLVERRHRVRFKGVPSSEFGHLVGRPSPLKWQRGERWPTKTMALAQLRSLYADVEPITTADGPAQRAVINGTSITSDADGNLTIEAPPGIAVTVKSISSPAATPHLPQEPMGAAVRALDASANLAASPAIVAASAEIEAWVLEATNPCLELWMLLHRANEREEGPTQLSAIKADPAWSKLENKVAELSDLRTRLQGNGTSRQPLLLEVLGESLLAQMAAATRDLQIVQAAS